MHTDHLQGVIEWVFEAVRRIRRHDDDVAAGDPELLVADGEERRP
jgi:hypothetical protein